MIQDINNFLDPTGGLNYGGAFHGVGAGLAGIGSDLANSTVIKPFLRKERMSFHKSFVHARTVTDEAMKTVKMGSVLPVYRGSTYKEDLKAHRKKLLNKELEIPRKRLAELKYTSNVARKAFKAAGWGFMLTSLVELGVAVAAPGINKLASRKDARLLYDERPLDSSAAYTQRQRALMAIHDSQLGLRGVVGSESQFLHK
jgi:hypothetical protein